MARTFAAFRAAGLGLTLTSACASMPTEGCQTAGYIHPGSWELLDCYAQMGNRTSALRLGEMFERGEGVPQNLQKAVGYYTLAGVPYSGDGFLYVPAIGHAPDTIRSLAKSGLGSPPLPAAQLALARLYADGRGVKRDLKAARHWATLALQGEEAAAAEALLRNLETAP